MTGTAQDRPTTDTALVLPFSALRHADVAFAGGKGANLGELTAAGFPVPGGIVIGAPAYAAMCAAGGLRGRLEDLLAAVGDDDPAALEQAAATAREMVEQEPLPDGVEHALRAAIFATIGEDATPVAVRSSATAEDTAAASFAGMNASFLNVIGVDAVLAAVRRCWASLFGARSIVYRAERGFGQAEMDIAVVVQLQIQSARAGVMFTADPTGAHPDRIVIEGAFGLGESVVSGSVSPDRYVVAKPDLEILTRDIHRKELVIESTPGGGIKTEALSPQRAADPVLSDEEVLAVAALGVRVEQHYGRAQDTEWAYDPDGRLWLLQARPVTTGGHGDEATPTDGVGEPLVSGLAAAPGVASGRVRIVEGPQDAGSLVEGEVLVAQMTSPDWVPFMRRAAAIVTDSGGITCHAAIVSRELGIPCVVGTTDATTVLENGREVTVDATRGVVTAGRASVVAASVTPAAAVAPATAPPVTATKLLVNLSEPSQVDRVKELPVEGVGLLRAELMLLEALDGTHPLALIEAGEGEHVIERMATALERFATGFAPRPITYRTIDFRTNEFRGLTGGERFEPVEANPMLGFRGAYRYTKQPKLLELELQAIARVCDGGADNLHVMLPFVRTELELRRCIEIVERSGLPGRRGYELWIMAEVPSVLFNLERYAALGITGISIGSNDLTQLLLGVDRDSELLAELFDARDPAVLDYLRQLIPAARALGLKTSICGQAPSLHPEYAEVLVRAGIDAVSVTPDAVDRTRRLLAAAEQLLLLEAAREGAAR